jgi:hypothetical protein
LSGADFFLCQRQGISFVAVAILAIFGDGYFGKFLVRWAFPWQDNWGKFG